VGEQPQGPLLHAHESRPQTAGVRAGGIRSAGHGDSARAESRLGGHMMRWLRRFRARIRYRHFESDLQAEIETHRSLLQDDLARSGADNEAARAAAARALGNVTLQREQARGVWFAP